MGVPVRPPAGPTPETKKVVEADPEDTEWPLIQERKKNGTLKAHLLNVVKAYAERKVDDEDDDGRWAKVKTLSNKEIWEVIQWCEYERGAINMKSRATKTMRVDTPVTKPVVEPDVEPA